MLESVVVVPLVKDHVYERDSLSRIRASRASSVTVAPSVTVWSAAFAV